LSISAKIGCVLTDPQKRSKAGRLVLMKKGDDNLTVCFGSASQKSSAAKGIGLKVFCMLPQRVRWRTVGAALGVYS
jgi:hypothetical protein